MNENGSLIFIGLCLFLPMLIPIFIGTPPQETKIIYVEKKQKQKKRNPIEHLDFPSRKDPQKVVKKEKPLIVDEIDIRPDAIECLISLGMKKTAAKEKVDKMFKNKKYMTVESFLIDAYRI